MPGRKRKPDHLKVLTGTLEPRRSNADAPSPNPGVTVPPEWLSDRAAEIFATTSAILEGMGIASTDDVHVLAMLASRLEEIELMTAIIEDAGRTYQTTNIAGDVMYRARPEVGMRNEAMRHAQSLLAEFGLTPAARSKVSAQAPKGRNPFAALDDHVVRS
ncbi:P27 family predicted phage terminase small subunit [Palleronia aestuarii]|uniref:P27 family predicted phage terminase small subunit n=1 Tax=Palleronia aestuarii TaxID=568105 RepID=A0A2W7NQ60_9RHOB|nr:phage terminase small subunit P27 family [Palleronia aestuarii]PZX18754.1 P27 family predicted phage terminase small subunit [Palleronia aestuarii]